MAELRALLADYLAQARRRDTVPVEVPRLADGDAGIER
jgi:hypothetical protein